MSIKSDEFEQKIARIKEVLENNESKIVWNDKIPDPDNIKQLRQIDISIKNKNKTTHVECRIHKTPQDVKWIEELIGRKISLNIDSIIGVSSSGFTKGALLKAQSKGIILRDFNQVTIEEAKSWGEVTEIDINWLLFNNIKLHFVFPKNTNNNITNNELINWINQKQDVIYELIEKSANEYPHPSNPNDKVKRIIQNNFTISKNLNNLGFKKIILESDTEYFRTYEEVVSYHSFGDPNEKEIKQRTSIEENSSKSIELISSSNFIGVTLDLSKIIRPNNSIFKSVGWKVKKPSNGIKVNLVKTFERSFTLENLKIEVSFEK